MAQQRSILPLNGTIQQLTFYKTGEDGYMAKEKTIIEADKILKSPNYIRVRENMAEFGRAGKAAKLVKNSFIGIMGKKADTRSISRMLKLMMQGIRADSINIRGERNIVDGEPGFLKGFEFNNRKLFTASFNAPFTVKINRATGVLSVQIEPYVPINMVIPAQGATHYKIMAGGSAIDFAAETYEVGTVDNGIQAISPVLTAAASRDCTVTPGTDNPLFLAVGIQFYQEVNGNYYELLNGSFNALAIVDVNTI